MSEEQRRILQMLQEGKITSEEADRLLLAVEDFKTTHNIRDTASLRDSRPGES